jgi:hypothetical protein
MLMSTQLQRQTREQQLMNSRLLRVQQQQDQTQGQLKRKQQQAVQQRMARGRVLLQQQEQLGSSRELGTCSLA